MSKSIKGCFRPEPFRVDDDAVKNALDELESETIDLQGLRNISGGFASADIFDYDEAYFDVELKFGIQDGDQNTVHTEQYRMDRLTLQIKD